MRLERTAVLLVTLMAAGLVGGCGDEAVEPLTPTTIAVSPGSATLQSLAETVQLTAAVRDQNGQPISGVAIAWASSDPSVATVDASGLVTAVGNGVATMTATAGSASGTARVTVMQVASSVDVSPPADTIAPGDTVRLSAEASDANGHPVADAAIEWASGDTLVAMVDAAGLVTAVGRGSATVTATAGTASGEASVTVISVVVDVSPPSPAMTPGDTLRLTAEAFDADGTRIEEFDWTSSDVTVARVDATGLVTGVAHGRATITATTGGRRGTAEIRVMSPARLALVTLYEATDGPNWVDSENWLTDAPLGEWYGVSMDQDGRVVGLTLAGNYDREVGRWVGHGLSGTIPPELGGLTHLQWLDLRGNNLTGEIPPELGGLANLEQLNLFRNDLTGEIPPELGGLANLERLNLFRNDLTGEIPPELGGLANLKELLLLQNNLTGEIPPELGGLAHLQLLDLAENGLTGEIPPELGDLARLARLNLASNGLTGGVPPELGALAGLWELMLGDNLLTGALPRVLVELPLTWFSWDCGPAALCVCAPGTSEFVSWVEGIENSDDGPYCNTSDQAVLANLFNHTGGHGWAESDGWLGDRPALEEWHGVEGDSLGRVTALHLSDNGLSGFLPGDISLLAQLRRVHVDGNPVGGRVPASLTGLALEEFHYDGTDLCEPTDDGFRAWLTAVGSHRGTGVECGALTDRDALVALYASTRGQDWQIDSNWLSDQPLRDWQGVEVDEDGRVVVLRLSGNGLAGGIPSELGGLANLKELDLAHNGLAGGIPPDLGALADLRKLLLSQNRGLAGVIPENLLDLELEEFLVGGTDLCVPREPAFETWLRTIPTWRIASCGDAMAYLTQAVQSRRHPVPLVAGEEALLRVFVTAARATEEVIPPVRARFFVDGSEQHVAQIPAGANPIPTSVDEGELPQSANIAIPGQFVRPGLEMVVEIDPEDTLDPALGVPTRIPETGRMAVEVREMPVLRLTVVPFLWMTNPDEEVLDAVKSMEADPEGHALLEDTRTLLPVGDIDVEAHEPVSITSNQGAVILNQVEALRVIEGGAGHYLGMMSGTVVGPGYAHTPGWSSFAIPNPRFIAHELGHNMSLLHAPCGGVVWGLDPAFPDAEGGIAAWGYDVRSGRVVLPTQADLMSYCLPHWIGEYHFTAALRYRLRDERASAQAPVSAPARSLLLWGGVDPEGKPFLNPAFVVDAPAALPDSAGDHTLTGRDANGGRLFSLDFRMPTVESEEEVGSSFAFMLPVRPGWEDALAAITLSGPGGDVALDGDDNRPMAILRNPVTGQVRGFLSNLPQADQAAMDAARRAAEPGLEVLFSRGIPDAAAWRR